MQHEFQGVLPQLKPCPFCGGPAKFSSCRSWWPLWWGPLEWTVRCARGCTCPFDLQATTEDAAALWNHRAP